jgi:hypothetical protein
MVIPKIAVTIKYPLFWSKTDFFFRVLRKAKGASATQAIVHLQKANPTGGIWSFIPLAITIFTDQSKVAVNAKRTPFV